MRRRHIIGVLCMVCLFALGGAVAWTQTGGETVATQTFTNVVTYTIPTETVTTVETVTVTAPTTTAAASPDGTTLTFTNVDWRCRAPIASYATDGMPLHVVVNTTNEASRGWTVNGAIRFDDGCTGRHRRGRHHRPDRRQRRGCRPRR